MWEETLLAYVDRSRIVPEAYRKAVTRVNGDVLPTLLVDGFIAGVWRAVEGGIEATAFHPLDDETWAGLDAEARSLRAFLADREPARLPAVRPLVVEAAGGHRPRARRLRGQPSSNRSR